MSVVFNAEGPFDSVSALRTGTSTSLCCAQDDRGPFDGAQDRPFDGAQDRPFDGAQDRPFDGAQDRPFDGAQDRPFDGAQDRLACWGRGKIIGPGKENEETLSVPLLDIVDFRTLW